MLRDPDGIDEIQFRLQKVYFVPERHAGKRPASGCFQPERGTLPGGLPLGEPEQYIHIVRHDVLQGILHHWGDVPDLTGRDKMLLFFAGIMVGAAAGMIFAALLSANHDDDDCSRGHPA